MLAQSSLQVPQSHYDGQFPGGEGGNPVQDPEVGCDATPHHVPLHSYSMPVEQECVLCKPDLNDSLSSYPNSACRHQILACQFIANLDVGRMRREHAWVNLAYPLWDCQAAMSQP